MLHEPSRHVSRQQGLQPRKGENTSATSALARRAFTRLSCSSSSVTTSCLTVPSSCAACVRARARTELVCTHTTLCAHSPPHASWMACASTCCAGLCCASCFMLCCFVGCFAFLCAVGVGRRQLLAALTAQRLGVDPFQHATPAERGAQSAKPHQVITCAGNVEGTALQKDRCDEPSASDARPKDRGAISFGASRDPPALCMLHSPWTWYDITCVR